MAHEHSGNGFSNGNSPWWVKAIVQVGIPASLALFLVWYITLGPAGDRTEAHETAATANAIRLGLDKHMTHTEQLHHTMEEYMRVNTLLMRQLCVTTARSNGDDTKPCFYQ
jgi:hypothetical protein